MPSTPSAADMLSTAEYKKLVTELGRALAAARSARSVDQSLVDAYWAVGERIS